MLFLCCFSYQTQAEQNTSLGLAMHGQPKYSTKSTHLSYANPNAPKTGSITYNIIGSFDSLNPYALKGSAAKGLNLVYDRLMGRVWDEPFTMYPLIAQKAVLAQDRSSITFTLNPLAKFHDGTSITTEDVAFSFHTLKEHGRQNMRAIYKLVENIEIKSPSEIHFAFGPGFDQETALIIAMMPVLSKSWWEQREFNASTLDIPMLSGPYTIESIDPGRKITYKRKADYWAKDLFQHNGLYNFDSVTYDYYRDESVAFEAFQAGDIDVFHEQNANRWAVEYNFPRIKNKEVVKKRFPHGRPEKVHALIFNTRRMPFDDKNVRKALNLAFDFDWINTNLYHGQYKRITSFFPGSELAANNIISQLEREFLEQYGEDIAPEVFNPIDSWLTLSSDYPAPSTPSISSISSTSSTSPASSSLQTQNQASRKARMRLKEADKLLSEAGWTIKNQKRVKEIKDEKTGISRDVEFHFEILLSSPEQEKIVLHFKKSLEKLGIYPSIRVMDASAFQGRLSEYDFDMSLYFWRSSLSPGTEQNLYWSCQAGKKPSHWNFPGICNEAIDNLANIIAKTKTREDLVAATKALDRLLLYGHYIIPLQYLGADLYAYKNTIGVPKTTALYGPVLESWWMETQEQ